MKTFRHPVTKEIRPGIADDADVQIAALKKLGYVAITAADIAGEPSLSVTYETVTNPKLPETPPALPKLTTPVPDAPTRDMSAPVQPKATPGITREDVQPLGKDSK